MMSEVRTGVARGHWGIGGAGAIVGGGGGWPIVWRGAVRGCWSVIGGRG